ncbi:hypothetical protein KZO25_11785 [Halomonas sp. ANAO-440]|uniref:hypothetical protein n=1 Tax=Halomonas sp. ANAO-440 TaxID=2861360 RepID=UPI001CAA4F63|nr:hypothetical protein [Halomonas sp. ANAO-440]MBZ0330996.1 hypothetical protein [Halomonas sp. ANAO-440]
MNALKKSLIRELFSNGHGEIAESIINNTADSLDPIKKDILTIALRRVKKGSAIVTAECGIVGSPAYYQKKSVSDLYRADHFAEIELKKEIRPFENKMDSYYERLIYGDWEEEDWDGW